MLIQNPALLMLLLDYKAVAATLGGVPKWTHCELESLDSM